MSIMSARAATYAKRPPLGANKSDFCRQVWSQCKQMNILAVKVAWASAGASRNRPRMPMHERLVNIIPTRNPQGRPGMQRLPGNRSWTVTRSAKRGLWHATKEKESKPSSIFSVGDRRKSKKIPGEHNLHVTERHTSVTGNTCNEIQPSQNMKR